MTTKQIDLEKAEAFAGRILGVLNDGAITLMLSIGHRVGLFEALAKLSPATSSEVAKAAGLQERYVREWLGGMAVSKIVTYDPATQSYTLPPEHGMFLTQSGGPNNMAVYARALPTLATVEDGVVECFRKGGGVPYSALPNFQEVQALLTNPLYEAYLVDQMLPLAPGLIDQLNRGIDVADIGCGQGHAVNLMARAFPNSRFVGYDFSAEGVAAGRTEAKQLGISNVSFEVKDAALLGVVERFDLITTFDAIHDQAKPDLVLRNIWSALRPGGVYFLVDEGASSCLEENLDHPIGPFLYAASILHCMTVSLSQGGPGLGALWGEQTARRMLEEAGFQIFDTKRLESDIEHVFFVATKC